MMQELVLNCYRNWLSCLISMHCRFTITHVIAIFLFVIILTFRVAWKNRPIILNANQLLLCFVL